MRKINKVHSLKISAIFIYNIFLALNSAYSQPILETLRIPVGQNESKIRIELINLHAYIKNIGDRLKEVISQGYIEKQCRYSELSEKLQRLKDILCNESSDDENIIEDTNIIISLFLQSKFKEYFKYHIELDFAKIELSRDILVRLIRDLYDPTFERDNVMLDLFSGTHAPSVLPEDELRRLTTGNPCIYGIDYEARWDLVSTKEDRGLLNGLVEEFKYYIPPESVIAITMYNPLRTAHIIKGIEMAEKVLINGGYIYIAPESMSKLFTSQYEEEQQEITSALKKNGFVEIEIIDYPSNFPISDMYGPPYYLIKARKNIDSNQEKLDTVSVAEEPIQEQKGSFKRFINNLITKIRSI